jgi:hypothetical protein
MEPVFRTEPALLSILHELMKREPIFHTGMYRSTPADHEKVLDAEFWKVGGSGRRYSRKYILDELEKRGPVQVETSW